MLLNSMNYREIKNNLKQYASLFCATLITNSKTYTSKCSLLKYCMAIKFVSFTVTSYRKTQKNFLSNPKYSGSEFKIWLYN